MPKYTMKKKPYKKQYSYAKKIYAIEKKVNKLNKRMEVKFATIQFDNVVNNNGTISSLLNAISQGTSDSGQRIGDKIRLKKIHVNYYVTENTSVANFGPVYARMILYLDREVNLTLASDVITNSGSPMAPLGQKNWDLSTNQKWYKDKKFALNTSTGATHIGSFSVNFKDLPVFFDAGTSALVKNDLKMLVISSELSASNIPTMRYTARIEYFDS